MTALIDLAREALEELRKTQFRNETQVFGVETFTVRVCTGCNGEVRIPGSGRRERHTRRSSSILSATNWDLPRALLL